METLLQNNWVISIVCSLIATFIAFIFSQIRKVFKREKQKNNANQFVVNQLRAFIVNGGMPNEELIKTLIRCTARKFKVKENDLLAPVDFLEEIEAEIVGNVYLTIDSQSEYICNISNLISEQASENTEYTPIVQPWIVRALPFIAIFFTALAIIISGLAILQIPSGQPASTIDSLEILMLAFTLVAMIVASLLSLFLKYRR